MYRIRARIALVTALFPAMADLYAEIYKCGAVFQNTPCKGSEGNVVFEEYKASEERLDRVAKRRMARTLSSLCVDEDAIAQFERTVLSPEVSLKEAADILAAVRETYKDACKEKLEALKHVLAIQMQAKALAAQEEANQLQRRYNDSIILQNSLIASQAQAQQETNQQLQELNREIDAAKRNYR